MVFPCNAISGISKAWQWILKSQLNNDVIWYINTVEWIRRLPDFEVKQHRCEWSNKTFWKWRLWQMHKREWYVKSENTVHNNNRSTLRGISTVNKEPNKMHKNLIYCRQTHYVSHVSLSHSRDTAGAQHNLNGSHDLTTPLSGMVCHQWASTCYDQSVYQIWSVYLYPLQRYDRWYKILNENGVV